MGGEEKSRSRVSGKSGEERPFYHTMLVPLAKYLACWDMKEYTQVQ